MRELVATDGLYRLRLTSALDSGAAAQTVSTSFPARCLPSAAADGGLALDLLDGRRVVAIAISSPCSRRSAAPQGRLQLPSLQALELRVPSAAPDVLPLLMQSAQAGSGTPGASSTPAGSSAEQQRMRDQGEAQQGKKDEGGDKGKAKEEEKTWLQKNWMVVMPLGFIVSGFAALRPSR